MILQFGTSRFLQAHVDLFAWEAREAGQDVPGIVVAQVSGDPARAKRLAAFADPAGFPIIVRGLEHGDAVERQTQVRSVVGGLSAQADWPALVDLFVDRIDHVVSNSGDTGFAVAEADRALPPPDCAPQSFGGILVALLHRRWRAGRLGVTFLPCELVAANGTTLRDLIVGLAEDQGATPISARGSAASASGRTRWSTASSARRSNPPARSPSPMRCG